MMRKKRIPVKIIVICLVLVASAVALLGATRAGRIFKKTIPHAIKPRYVEGQVVVKFKKSAAYQTRVNKVYQIGVRKLADLDTRGYIAHVQLRDGQSVADAIASFKNDPDIEYVEPNYLRRAFASPNDAGYGKLWGLKNTGQTIVDDNGYASYRTNNPGTAGCDMNLEAAWDNITDCSTVVVAVLDSGVKYDHADLSSNMWTNGSGYYGRDFVANNNLSYPTQDNDPMDENGHGTHVAGTIGAVGNNNTGITGVCWKARIMAVRVLDKNGEGTTSIIVSGINYAVANGANVINISLGSGNYSQAEFDAINAARSAGVLVVAAAGNDGEEVGLVNSATFPCNYGSAEYGNLDNVLCVGALDQSYRLAGYSNYSGTSVHLAAPGSNIYSTWAYPWVIREDFNTDGATISDGWTIAGTTGSTWGYQFNWGLDFITIPHDFDLSTKLYDTNTSRKVYKTWDMTGKSNIQVKFYLIGQIYISDTLYFYYKDSSGDPTVGGTILDYVYGSASSSYYVEGDAAYSLANCANKASCGFGFRFISNSVQKYGVAISSFELTSSVRGDGYLAVDGTSMAAPNAAGVAALVWAYNGGPARTSYGEVINAIKNHGTTLPDSGDRAKIASGRAVNPLESFKHISTPSVSGMSATKTP